MKATGLKTLVAHYIEDRRLLDKSRLQLVALSGGADSVALLMLLRDLGYRLEAVHCNFQLRGDEADRAGPDGAAEKAREEFETHLYESSLAAIAPGEATARAVQRIPDAHCNGDMHAALDYAAEVKHKQRDFVAKRGISAIIN